MGRLFSCLSVAAVLLLTPMHGMDAGVQPVFFSMLFPQLIPQTMVEPVMGSVMESVTEPGMQPITEATAGEAVRL